MEFELNNKKIIALATLSSSFVFAGYTSVLSDNSNIASDPIGTVVMWSSSSVPENWERMAGQSTAGNPELAAIYGANVPDMSGLFVRGNGGNSAALNRIQTQSLKGHNHSASFSGNALPNHNHSYSRIRQVEEHKGTDGNHLAGKGYRTETSDAVSAGTPTGTVSVSVSGSAETRPVNVGVYYLVKVR